MPTNMIGTWTEYFGQLLSPGDKVMFHNSKKLEGKVGVVKKKLTKNYSVIVDGEKWRVSPEFIKLYKPGRAENVITAERDSAIVKCDAGAFGACNLYDVVLMYRGKFEVVRIVDFADNGNPRCKILDGRDKNKVYGYKPKWFVQKLDQDLFPRQVKA